ncbi:hypothetical protein NTK89_001650 [Vibrio fluvialis]|nr:hypothetical protein [Vibrio fluvialis]
MTKRISLYKFNSSMNVEEISDAMINMRYTENKSSGFMLVKVNNGLIVAKHVNEIIVEREVVSPFGDVEVDVVKDYLINEFEIRGNLLKVIDATKNLSSLRNDLSKALSYKCSISFPNINLNELAKVITQDNEDVSIVSIDAFSRDIIPQTTIKMSMSSNRDLLTKMKNKFGDSTFEIRRLTLNIRNKGKIEISYRGGIKVLESENELNFYHEELSRFLKW